jgi:hypothetical protein
MANRVITLPEMEFLQKEGKTNIIIEQQILFGVDQFYFRIDS